MSAKRSRQIIIIYRLNRSRSEWHWSRTTPQRHWRLLITQSTITTTIPRSSDGGKYQSLANGVPRLSSRSSSAYSSVVGYRFSSSTFSSGFVRPAPCPPSHFKWSRGSAGVILFSIPSFIRLLTASSETLSEKSSSVENYSLPDSYIFWYKCCHLLSYDFGIQKWIRAFW